MNQEYFCRYRKADGTFIYGLSLKGLNAIRARLNLPLVSVEQFLPSKRFGVIKETVDLCPPELATEIVGEPIELKDA